MFSQGWTVGAIALEVLSVIFSTILSKKYDEDSESQAKENQELIFSRIPSRNKKRILWEDVKVNQIKMQFTILMKS